MWSSFFEFQRWGMSHIYGLNRNEWLIVLVVVMLLGFICMRGFGSRKNY